MANFIGLVYATLKSEGIDTAGMSTDEAVAKYNELQKEGGGKAGENEGTPAENRKLEEKGYTFKKNTKNGEQIVNKYQQDGETHIIAKAEDGSFVVGYNYNEDKGTFENSAKFSSMKEAEQAFRKNNPNARLTEQNLSKTKKPSLVDTEKIDKTISKLESKQEVEINQDKPREDRYINNSNKDNIVKPSTIKNIANDIKDYNGSGYVSLALPGGKFFEIRPQQDGTYLARSNAGKIYAKTVQGAKNSILKFFDFS